MSNKIVNKQFIHCEFCNKRLIERLPNGLLRFLFGKNADGKTPVDILIHGSIKIRCIKRTCRKYNVIQYFPQSGSSELQSEETKNNLK